MQQNRENFLVETEWLAAHLSDPEIRIVDMRGYVRTVTDDEKTGHQAAHYVGAPEEYQQGHIPGALYLDWTRDIVNLSDPVEAQVATPEQFKQAMERAGIGDQHLVVAYDSHPASQFATRFWWALRYYGHTKVVVLNGGFRKWTSEQRPVTQEVPTFPAAQFTPRVQPELRATYQEVLEKLHQSGITLVDARDHGQYSGAIARGTGRRGHIPGAINLPREALIDPDNGTFRSNAELQKIFDNAHITSGNRIIAYCNGGVAATSVLFGLAVLGYPHVTNYDGSWNEWGDRQDLPVER